MALEDHEGKTGDLAALEDYEGKKEDLAAKEEPEDKRGDLVGAGAAAQVASEWFLGTPWKAQGVPSLSSVPQ